MSFSGEVKEELSHMTGHGRHCQIAELAALILFSGQLIQRSPGQWTLAVKTENRDVLRKYFTLLKKTYNINTDVLEQVSGIETHKSQYTAELSDPSTIVEILQGIKWMDTGGMIVGRQDVVSDILIQNAETKRAFIRGAYLAAGSMSDPMKGYHLEFVCITGRQADQLNRVLHDFDIDSKIVLRKKYHVVYVKEGSGIVDLLNIMEAHVSLMNLENLRIEKEIRNTVNRRVNCETANITKTVNAATKQVEDILLIRDRYGFGRLPENLSKAAQVRLDYPDTALKELGEMLDPPVGKSGMNHRLRKLGEIADQIRTGNLKEE